MGWTKRQLIEQAYSELGLASYAFDLQPEQLQAALRTMDALVAEWSGTGLFLYYPMASTPEGSDIDADSNVPDKWTSALYLNLAVRLAPSLGKTPLPGTLSGAHKGFAAINRSQVQVLPRVADTWASPMGAGNTQPAGTLLNFSVSEEVADPFKDPFQ